MIYFQSVTGQTISAQAYQGSTTVGASFSLAEIGATGLYFAAYPSLSAGEYLIAFNASGAVLGSGVLVWDGTGEIMTGYVAPANADIAAIKAKTDTLANGPSLAAIEGSTVLAKEATVTSRASQSSVDALGAPAQASALATLASTNQTEHDATQSAISAIPAPLDSTATQAAAAAALNAYDGLVATDIAGLALEATAQAIKAKTDALTNGPSLAAIEGSAVLAKESTLATKASQSSVDALGVPAQASALAAMPVPLDSTQTQAAAAAALVAYDAVIPGDLSGLATPGDVTAAQAAIIAAIPASAPTAIENAAAVRSEIDAELALIRNNVPLIPAGL